MARWSQRPNTGVARFNANRNSSTVCLEVKSPSVRSSYYLSRQSWRAGLSRRERGMSRSLWRCDISKRLRLRSHDIPLSQRGAGGFADHTVCRKKNRKKKGLISDIATRIEMTKKEISLLRFEMIKMYPHVWYLKIKVPPSYLIMPRWQTIRRCN